MQSRESFIRHYYDEKFRVWFAKVCVLTVLYLIISSTLDLVREPHLFLPLLAHRLPAMAVLLGARHAMLHWRRGMMFHHAIAAAAIMLLAAEAEHRILLTGGAASPYFVEMIVIGILFVGYVPGSLWFWSPVSAAVCLIYAVPLTLSVAGDATLIEFNTVYIVLAYLLLLYMRMLRNRAVLRQLDLRYEMPHRQPPPE